MAITQEIVVADVRGFPGTKMFTHDHDEDGNCGPDRVAESAGYVNMYLTQGGAALSIDEAETFVAQLREAIEEAKLVEDYTENATED